MVYSRILKLRFPQTEVQKPIVCYLAKDFDLTFNILNAAVLSRKEGVMVLELSGTPKNYRAGVQYLKDQGVHVKNADQEIRRDKKNVPIAVPVLRYAPQALYRSNAPRCLSILTRKNAASVNFASLFAPPGR